MNQSEKILGLLNDHIKTTKQNGQGTPDAKYLLKLDAGDKSLITCQSSRGIGRKSKKSALHVDIRGNFYWGSSLKEKNPPKHCPYEKTQERA